MGFVPLAGGSRIRDEGARGSLVLVVFPGQQSCRGTLITIGPFAEPEKASGRLCAESQIEPWFASRDRTRLVFVQFGSVKPLKATRNNEEEDCPTPTEAPQDRGVGEEERTDCPEKNDWAIRKGEVCP